MKMILAALNIMLFFLFFSEAPHAETPLKCTSQYKFRVDKGQGFTQFTGSVNLLLLDESRGFFAVTGTVDTPERRYSLSRTSFFSITPHAINQVHMVSITKVLKTASDDTPDKVWLNDIFPAQPGANLHVEIWRLQDNLRLVKSLNTGYLICAAD